MRRRHRIVVLLLAPVVGFDAAIPPQVFACAVDEEGRPLYEVTTASLDGRPVATRAGYAIAPESDASAIAEADTLIIPGTRFPAARYDGVLDPELEAAVAALKRGTRLVSICTGAFALASLGAFEGRRATTHWLYTDDFRGLYPEVELDEGRLFVDEGDVLSSAGLAAGIDLCLHLIRRDHGSAVANRAAREMVVPAWRDGGQAQFIERPVPPAASCGTGPAREWALAHLDEPLDVATLARKARMSVRTFNRRFREETGLPPGVWLSHQRVDHARRLLETTDLSVDEVARRAGLGTGATLRQRLRATVGVAPSAYRRAFQDPEAQVGRDGRVPTG